MANQQLSYTIQLMQSEDEAQALAICSQFNWLMSKYDFILRRSVDADGCFVAKQNETGKVIGLCCGLILSPSFAFIGVYGVHPDYQNKGIGQAIWRRVMQHLEPDKRNIGLCAMPKMFPVYRDRLGFTHVADKRLHKYKGRADISKLTKSIDGIEIVKVTEENIDSVVKYDSDVCDGLDRSTWLKTSMNLAKMVFLAAVSKSDDQVKGCCALTPTIYGTVRCFQLYADEPEIAECLLSFACPKTEATKNGFHMLGWDCNDNTKSIADKLGLELYDKEPILFTKKIIHGKMEKIYNVNSHGVYPF